VLGRHHAARAAHQQRIAGQFRRNLRNEAEIDGCGWFSLSATRDTFFSHNSK